MAKRMNIELSFDKALFPRVLKAKRLEFGRSVSEFAELIQCSPEQLDEAEQGRANLLEKVVEQFLKHHAFYSLSKLCLMASSQGIGISKLKVNVGPKVFKQLQALFSEAELKVRD